MEKENDKLELVYGVEDKPSPLESSYAALQHLLAIIVGIITPTIIIGGALGLGEHVPYLISMSLMVSGVATFIQARRIGPIGSGLLSVQGTSFAFLGAVLAAGFSVKAGGGGPDEILGTIFGICFVGAFIEMIISRFLHILKKIITPVVTGTVVMIIGLSLVKVGITDMAGGQYVKDKFPDQFGSIENLGLGILVLLVVLILNRNKNPMIRMGSIVFGIVVGYIVALFLEKVKFSFGTDIVSIPIPFKFGFSFDWVSFIGVAFIYIITAIESTGDLTATSMLSGEPVEGDKYMERIKGGVLGDGINSAIAAIFNTFPNTTFSQNNGVIQMTGVASRYVGMYLAAFLVILGLFPAIGGFFRSLPAPVLGGATIVMFGTVAASGVNIIASMGRLGRREILIIAVSLGIGLGLAFVPDVLQHAHDDVKRIFGSAITSGGLCALILNLVLPRNQS
tara:strand:+ start:989 stop:2341 length:1353 start_codon:yes stop_codon:yes gene_type:complete